MLGALLDAPLFSHPNFPLTSPDHPPTVHSLVLVKRGAVLEAEKPLTSQLLMTTLNEGSPYETLHTLISSAVSPFFKSYVKESGKGDR